MKNLFLSIIALTIVSGCIPTGIAPSTNTSTQKTSDLKTAQRIDNIDKQIEKEHSEISQSRDLLRTWNYEYIKLLSSGGPSTTRGGISNSGPIDLKHEIIRVQQDIIAVEADISRRNQRIDNLTTKKSIILNQGKQSCFPGNTFVQTKKGVLKPIKQVRAGDMIMAFDIGTQTNVARRVLNTYKDNNNHYYLINDSIKATAYERFLTTSGWRKVIHLKKGDKIQTNNGFEIINTLTINNGFLEVHNLQIEKSHTFYVIGESDKRYLVHNTGGGGGGGGSK